MTQNSGDGALPAQRPVYTRILAILLFGALALASWQSIRLARADLLFRENTLNSVERAVALEGGNAAYHELRGEHLEGLGSDPTPDFTSAAQLSPDDSRYWIRLSFFHEVQGDYQQAERELLRADKVDRKFGPPWALMNFYFRRNNPPQFWLWARRSLEIGFDDLSPIFRLCRDVSPDWRSTAAVLPPSHEVRAKFLYFLLGEGQAEDTGQLARQVAQGAQPWDVPTLLSWCDQAMEKDMPSAVATWNILCARGLVHQKPLSLADGRLVTNGDFSETPAETGFDWRQAPVEGVSVQFAGGSEGVHVDLSGAQPENYPLLWQPLPMSPGGQYILDYQYKISGSDRTPAVGVHWEITPPAGGVILARSDDFKVDAEWTSRQLRFAAADHDAAHLTLRYSRPPGSVRWAGKIALRNVVTRIYR